MLVGPFCTAFSLVIPTFPCIALDDYGKKYNLFAYKKN